MFAKFSETLDDETFKNASSCYYDSLTQKMKDAFGYFMLSENCAAMINATKENAVPSSLSKLRMLLKA